MSSIKNLNGNQINWNQVFYFSRVAAEGSIKAAAEKLGVTPPTLSEHISQLERELKVQLFLRQHRKLVLTPEGTRLYQHAREMFEAGQRLIDVLSPIPMGAYPISVGLVPSTSAPLAYDLVEGLLKKQGPLNMKIFHASHPELDEALLNARFDFGFSDRPSENKDISHRIVMSSETGFFVSKKWADSSLQETLSRIPLLICTSEPAARTAAEQALTEAEIQPCAIITSDYPSALLDLCQKGIGVGLFSQELIQHTHTRGLITLKTPRGTPILHDRLYALWSKHGENTAAIRHLKELLVDRLAGIG